MYSGVRLCIDAFAVICIVVGVGLFSGTKRETLWDRDNLVGLLLIGTALSIHGGWDTFFRSSPTLCSPATYWGGAVSQGTRLGHRERFVCTTSVIHRPDLFGTRIVVFIFL